MSTKTLRKRIALVAVSALGFGLVSTVPASAGIEVSTGLTVSANEITAGSPVTITVAGGGAIKTIALINPLGTRTYWTEDTAGDATVTKCATGALVTCATDNVFVVSGAALLVPGNWVISASTGAAGEADTAAEHEGLANKLTQALRVISPATATTMATAMNLGTYSGTTSLPQIRAWGPTAGFTGSIKFRVDTSPDLTAVGGLVVAATATAGSFATYTLDATHDDVAGDYTYTAFVDSNGDGLLTTGEPSSAITFTIGGAFSAADSSLTVSRTLAVAQDGGSAVAGALAQAISQKAHVTPLTTVTVTLTAKDADGNAATPIAPKVSESVDLTNMGASGAASVLNQVGTSNVWTATFTVAADAVGASTGFTENTVTLEEDGANTTKTVKFKVVYLQSEITDATLTATSVVGVGTVGALGKEVLFDNAVTGSATAEEIGVDPAVGASIEYTYQAGADAANEYILVDRVPTAGTSLANIPASSKLVRLGSDAKAVWTETVTAVTAEGYTLFVHGGHLATGKANAAITVTFATAAPALIATPTNAVLAKDGATTSFAGVLADQYGRALDAKTVIWSVAGRNPATGSVTTGADGSIPAVVVTDASGVVTAAATATVQTINSDTITFTYNYTTATGAAKTATGTQKVTYSLTGPSVATVAVASATTTKQIDQAKVAGTPARFVTYTATVRKADNTSSGTGILCTFAGGAGDLFKNGIATSVTDADGLCFIDAYRDLVGSSAITATAVGVTSAASTPVKWVNQSDAATATGKHDGRYITITGGTVVAGTPFTVVAKVTDRWGNPVAGVDVTFSTSGVGRLVSGETTAKETNILGEAQVQVSSTDTETGTLSVSATFTGSQASDIAGFVSAHTTVGTVGLAAAGDTVTPTAVTGVTAAVKSATASVVYTKNNATSTADALLALATALGTRDQASAAVDAAAEATDAANAATDAANAAAEAADAATAAAQDAADAVAALSTQVSEMVAALKKQITSLTNLVIKIQKKVKA
jgi:trimeric autotransporter adhesin